MRCPYCGGINQERAAFCVNCGRDLARGAAQQRQQPVQPPYAPPARPANQPAQRGANTQTRTQQGYPPAPPRPVNQPVQSAASANRRRPQTASPAPAPVISVQPAPPPAPEPPGPFPPRSMDQFTALVAAGAQQYTILERVESNGKKSCLRIAYPDCAGWQQVATLLKAFQEQADRKFDTIIIQGFSARRPDASTFNQGQLQFDRNVLLGSRKNNRYIVETGNSFASDTVRFVLNE